MRITRRLFLRNTAAVGAAGAIGSPAVAEAAKPMSAHELAIWHIRELERLTIADGGSDVCVFVSGSYGPDDYRSMTLSIFGHFRDADGMFSAVGRKGGAA